MGRLERCSSPFSEVNLSNQFFYCYKCLIHSNSDAKVHIIFETKEDFEEKDKIIVVNHVDK